MDNSQIIPIGQVKLWEKNPRSIEKKDFERLKKQITKHGVYKPLIVCRSGEGYEVIGGNMRLRALQDMGFKEVWVSVVEPKTDAEKVEIALSDNDRAGSYDEDALAELVYEFKDEIDLKDYHLDLGKTVDLSELLDNYAPSTEKDDEVPEDVPAVAKLGDIYILGNHRIMCGDSTKKEDVERLMDGKKADMVFTDPPYAVNYGADQDLLNMKSGNKAKLVARPIEGDNMTAEECSEKLWRPSFKNLYEFSKDDCSFYMTMCQGGDQMMMMMMMSENWQIKHELIWVKSSPVFSMGRLDYDYQHEPILFGWKKKHNFYGNGQFLKSIWTIPKPSKSDLHPTMKPVELIENALANSSKKDDICLDLFLGSGSTLIACEKLNRICYGMELEPHYIDVIIARWQEFTGKVAVKCE
ncbi:MAG: DNA methyltransferase [Gallionella sp.]|jgi:DNA modification methylase